MLSLEFIRRFRRTSLPVRQFILKRSFSRQERSALRGKTPMTWELLAHCLWRCYAAGVMETFCALRWQFPEAFQEYMEHLDTTP